MTRMRFLAGLKKPVHLGGWRPDTKDHRDILLPPRAEALPSAATLRPGCPPVVDQGPIGSCTANASASALSFLYRRGAEDPLFSRLYVYYYARKIAGVPPNEDSGSQIRDAMKVLSLYGAPPENVWPYLDWQFSVEPPHVAFVEGQPHRALFYYRCPDLSTIQGSIVQGFPIVIGFSVPENIDSEECTRTGVVTYPRPSERFIGGHAVLAVGYDDETKLVCFQNSWGAGWGDRGFGFLPYRMFTDGFVQDCWTLRRKQMP